MGRPASGKWRAEPRSEPDSGHPTVRDRRGALGDVTHGEPRNPTRKSKERLWSLLAYRCARPGSIPTTRTSGSVGGQGQQRPWSTRPRRAGGCSRTRWLDPILGRETVNQPGHIGLIGAVGHEPRPRAPAAAWPAHERPGGRVPGPCRLATWQEGRVARIVDDQGLIAIGVDWSV